MRFLLIRAAVIVLAHSLDRDFVFAIVIALMGADFGNVIVNSYLVAILLDVRIVLSVVRALYLILSSCFCLFFS